MCGGGDKASKEARRAEEKRKAELERATNAIDSAFLGREGQIAKFVEALRSEFLNQAQQQKQVTDRNLRFSMARSGLTGGSASADAGRQLGEEFTRGILQGDRRAQSAGANLRSADEQARADLLRMAQGGADASTAAANAARALRSNLQGAQASSLVDGLGDIFGNTSDLYRRQQEAAARRRGLRESEVFASPFSRD